ncbi:hypothetical protein GCM10009087_47540 [Sphingomonas oligophenolica]|uniref:Uncharacterized protein n=1 Tax=Sphingomonas oligophenolica TaxID=301154 RepID=A0ABU9Y7A7_9SPHN
MTALAHPLTWAAPRPLWRGGASPGRAPTILRFATDDFMDQLLGMLATDPGSLADHVARYETWRSPPGTLATEDLIERVPLPAPLKQSRLMTRLARAPKPIAVPAAGTPGLKLYQPAHQRYYIACATLACAIPGLPDRKLAGGHEQVGFVLRRRMPATANAPAGSPLVEYGYVKDAAGVRWQRVSDGNDAVLAPGEERLPAFPLAHQDGHGLKRSLWGGLIPVGRREQYLSAPVTRTVKRLVEGQAQALAGVTPDAPRNSKLARTTEFKMDFAEPWKALIQAAMKAADDIDRDNDKDYSSPTKRQTRIRARNVGFQSQSWLLLLDLMAFLDRHLKTVAAAVRRDSGAGLSGAKLDLYIWLSNGLQKADSDRLANGFKLTGANPSPTPPLPHLQTLADALRHIDAAGGGALLEAAETQYRDVLAERARWPSFHYLLAGIASDGNGGAIDAGGGFRTLPPSNPGTAPDAEIDALTVPLAGPADPVSIDPSPAPPHPQPFDINAVEKLTVLVARALDTSDESDARAMPFAQQLALAMQDSVGDTGQFILRFVHLNADCGPIHPPTLSEPSVPFELANFFDPDAPARPVRITLPMDTSPAGLRKHARGTAFVLSDMLCGQVQRAKGMGFIDLVLQVLPWPLHKDIDTGDGGGCKNANGIDIGMICSLSIPIITICALILLTIIITLLDFIFRWVPFFILCFPVPKLKGKGGGG